MSFSSSHSIAFAKWVISKLPLSDENDDFVDNIDHTIWEEFLGTDEFKLVSKQNIDAIIPLLVEGITTKPSKSSKSSKPRKPTKIRSDAQTSTEDNDETNNIVIQVGAADDTLPKVKKPRAKKQPQIVPANNGEPVTMVEGDVVAALEGGDVQQAPAVPEPKVKKPRANKKLTQIVTDGDEPVVEPKVKKPRVNKKLTQQIVTAGDVPVPVIEPVIEHVVEPVIEPVIEHVVEPVVEGAVQQAQQVPEPKVKKPRANKKLMQILPAAAAEEGEGGVVQQAPAVPEPKVKKPRANKKLMQILPAAAEEEGGEVQQAPAVPEPKVKKPRVNKKLTQQIVSDAAEEGVVQQAPAVPEPKVKKPRANKKLTQQFVSDAIGDADDLLLDFNNLNISNNDDIVVPVQEHLQLEHARDEIADNNELVEDSYSKDEDEQHELTECFVDDVLFYTDEHRNWFDQHFQPVANPTI
jgi:hypothetical protein